MNHELLNTLVAPIPGEHPCGEDVSLLPEFDEIREARRQDDPALAQGDWETELKVAQWPKVRQLCEDLLHNKSKDLQVCCWYTESLAYLHGFAGLKFGFQLLEVLVTDFWEFFYPPLDPDDLEERAGKIDWLNKQLSLAIRNIPLTSKASGSYSWFKWNESRLVENLALKDAQSKEKAIAEGKLSGEIFDKAAIASGQSFYQDLHEHIISARNQILAVEKHIDERFGADSPGLKEVRNAVTDCEDVVAKLMMKLGGKAKTLAPEKMVTKGIGHQETYRMNQVMPATMPQHVPLGAIHTRADAIMALRRVSQFFKINEPHSPVGLLAERAARWAEMPLERWLASVIKDDATLAQLRELLDIPQES